MVTKRYYENQVKKDNPSLHAKLKLLEKKTRAYVDWKAFAKHDVVLSELNRLKKKREDSFWFRLWRVLRRDRSKKD